MLLEHRSTRRVQWNTKIRTKFQSFTSRKISEQQKFTSNYKPANSRKMDLSKYNKKWIWQSIVILLNPNWRGFFIFLCISIKLSKAFFFSLSVCATKYFKYFSDWFQFNSLICWSKLRMHLYGIVGSVDCNDEDYT